MDTQIAKQKEAEKFSDQQNLRKLGCKGQARPCSRSIGDYDGAHPIRTGLVVGVQGRAKSPLGHGGVGGAGTLRLTGDATATRCTGFDDLLKHCLCLPQQASRRADGDSERPVCRWGCNGARAAGAPCQGCDGTTIDTLRITLRRNLAIAESVEPTSWICARSGWHSSRIAAFAHAWPSLPH